MRNRHRFSAVVYVILCSPLWLFWIHTEWLWFTKTTPIENPQLTSNEADRIYDVIVYGATPSGIIASVTAAKMLRQQQEQVNPKVLLLNPNNHLGGMVSGGLGQSDIGYFTDKVIGGFAQEFFERVALYYKKASIPQPRAPWNVEPHVAESVFWDFLAEAGVEVVRNAGGVQALEWEDSDSRIQKILTSNSTSSVWWNAKVFVDSSYEGDLMAKAGVPFVVGREGHDTYDESLAGNLGHNDGHVFPVAVNPYADETNQTLLPYLLTPSPEGSIGDSDTKIQSYNFRLCVTNVTTNMIPFEVPTNYQPERWELLRRYISKLEAEGKVHQHIKVPTPNLGPLANGKFDCNNGGPISTDFVGGSWKYPLASYNERKVIWEAHKQYILELFWFLANDISVPMDIRNSMKKWGLCADEFRSNNHWPPQLYVREVIRMLGSIVFTQCSIEYQANIDIGLESIGLGSYKYDSHTAQRVPSFTKNHEAKTKNEGDLERNPKPPIYQIPYWVMVPPDIPNLLVSVCVSASHVAYSTLRMEPQFMILGQAAGTIAAMTSITRGSVQIVDLELLRKHLLDMNQKVAVVDGDIIDIETKVT